MLQGVSDRLILAHGRIYAGERFAEADRLESERVRAVGTLADVPRFSAACPAGPAAPAFT